jgi:M6 family metalloprotease-like protein
VDVLTVMHPTHGAECRDEGSSNRIWSHRWTVRNASQGRLDPGIPTATPRPDGQGMIHINDYTIQPLLSCDATDINEIGVFAHEMGHGFGLPDLYGTGGARHTGSGNWDLMGTGSWGCGFGSNPSRPCHMGAWTQAMLGWVDVEELAPGIDHGEITLPPVASSGRVARIPAGDGSGEYLLLENRQREGSQTELFEPGLLVWRVNPELVNARWGANAVNAEAARMGVLLLEADGHGALTQASGSRHRGSPGNPFPGCALEQWQDYFTEPWDCQRNREFHAGSRPAAVSGAGHALGVALTGIRLNEGLPADVLFSVSTRFQWDTVPVGLELEAAREHEIQFEAEGASDVRWRFLSGELPPGMELSGESGLLRGATLEMGEYRLVLAGADGIGREVVAQVALDVVLPDLPPEELLAPFLGGTGGPSSLVQSFLDRMGNRDGGYDLGDFRAYMQAREAASPATAAGVAPPRVVVPFPPPG